MIERGGGYLLNTSSAAGLLTQMDSGPYAVSKHASVALAEWLAINYKDRGIGVSVLCPQAVRTAILSKRRDKAEDKRCLLYTSPSPRDISGSRMPSSA